MKKILYIHHGQGLGGAPLSLLYLVENLDKKLYHPVVLFLKDSEVVDLYRSKGIEVVGPLNIEDFSHTKIWWYKWYHPHHLFRALRDTLITSLRVAKKYLNEIKPDIVHLNTSSLIAWGRVADSLGIPVIWHVREPLSEGYLGLRKSIVQKCVEKYSTFILPICKNDAKPWENNPKTHMVYNAVDPNKFSLDKAQPMSFRENSILFLGGLSKEKGTLVILKVCRKLLEKLPNAELVIAGYFNISPSKGCRSLLSTEKFNREVQQELNSIKGNVRFLGSINDVPSAMAASKVVVFPATVGHFARPIIEAGFMKRPVVASDLPPLDELVINNKTGFLVDPNNIDLWAERLYQLLTNQDCNKSMGNAGYENSKLKFDINDQVKIISNYYLKALEKNL